MGTAEVLGKKFEGLESHPGEVQKLQTTICYKIMVISSDSRVSYIGFYFNLLSYVSRELHLTAVALS